MTSDVDTSCFHCGEPVPVNCELAVEIDGLPRPMCCPGCQAVASLITGSGLDSFYRLRSGYSQRPEEAAVTELYRVYDDPENTREFVEELDNGERRAQLLLGGITCAACTWLIETVLMRRPGIKAANVNLARQSLVLVFDPRAVPLSQIFHQIEQLGYDPHPWQARRGAELLHQEQRAALRELAVAGLAMMQVGMFAVALHAGDLQGIADEYRRLLRWVSLLIATVVVGYAARSFFRNAWHNLRHGRLVMDVPVALAIGLAYAASAWATVSNTGQVYFDSIAMFTFFLLLGRFLERRVRQREFLRQTDLHSLLPLASLRAKGSGWEPVATREIRRGDRLLLKTGDIIPADGIVLAGSGSVDEAAFTGENFPRPLEAGAPVSAGTLLCDGSAEMRVSADAVQTRLATMLTLMGRAEQEKPRMAKVADRVAAWFVGAILLIAALVAAYWLDREPGQALWITLAVLVVSCPCALALATPAALASAGSALRRRGVLLVGENALETIHNSSIVLFDKTGTLTSGKLRRKDTRLCGDWPERDCLALAAALELHGNHPIAAAFVDIDPLPGLEQVQIKTGGGVIGVHEGIPCAIGNPGYIAEHVPGLDPAPDAEGHWIVLARGGKALAYFELADETRPEAAALVDTLQRGGRRVELLTGDPSAQGPRLAETLGMDSVHHGYSPARKLEYIQELQARGQRVAMVGDGLNDAPVLAAADCSFAVNQATDLAKSSADVILLNPSLDGLSRAFDSARRCRRIVRQNIGWALGYNLLAIPIAAAGMVPPWAAAIGMSASSLLVVLNSLRLK